MFGTVERLDWATAELAARGIPLLPGPDSAAELVEAARRHHLDVLVLDSYELDPAGAGALRAAGVYTLAIIDGDSRGQVADLYLDQNFGAELPGRFGGVPGLGSGRTAGLGLRAPTSPADCPAGCSPGAGTPCCATP